MTALPDIPRLYTALAECLAVLLYARRLPQRFHRQIAVTVVWALVLGIFLHKTGYVPLAWWVPCMLCAVLLLYGYLWGSRAVNWLEALYITARAFLLAEFAASAEWQLHCWLFPHRSGFDPLALALLAAVYGAVYGLMFWLERSRPLPEKHLDISNKAALAAFVMAGTVFVVSNLLFLGENPATMNVFCIRTLVDFCGVLILTLQHEQLRESALHQELSAMDNVLHRQYEQYKRSKEGIELINSRYHELKVQIADIRAQRDRAKQDAALAKMENSILQYEAENKTGNPVLDILLTAKTMECQQENITITSVADGRMLGFLTIRELCTIVGVALDNAIAAVRAEPDPEKRLIKVAVYSQGGFAILRFEHYTEAAPALDADGLPKQGSDLKSVRTTAQQHGGSMTMHWENNWCTLRILFPLPQNE